MTEDEHKQCQVSSLPTEVLLYIFSFLPAKQLVKSRQVCLHWKQVIDSLARSDVLWRSYCKTDFTNIYKVARYKSRQGLVWYHIYRSLTLWSRLAFAREVRDEFASASTVADEIRSFSVLSDGIIGVQKRSRIVYYDIETMEPCKWGPIAGDYMQYSENEHIIVILGYYLHLYVIRKAVHSPSIETNVTIDNVKSFLLVDREVYYINLDNEICVCRLSNDDLGSVVVARPSEGVMTLGYKDGHLQVLTFQRNIYTVNGKELVLACALESSSNLLQELRKYNLIDNVEWRVIFNWMHILKQSVPQGPLRDTIIIRTYGDVVFVGTNWGVLRIYHTSGSEEFDLFAAQPIKQYNFMERSDCPVLSTCPIIQIDAMEAEHGHTVVVAMPKKIAVIDFVYNFKRTATAAMLPYRDVQQVKMLKIEETI